MLYHLIAMKWDIHFDLSFNGRSDCIGPWQFSGQWSKQKLRFEDPEDLKIASLLTPSYFYVN